MRLLGKRGFTLLEVMISLSIVSLIFLVLLSGLFFVNKTEEKMRKNQMNVYDERYLVTFFQKQILNSEQIIIYNQRVYLQDLESPEAYYNYYESTSQMLRRYKVLNNEKMTSIGPGGNSQFSEKIKGFSMTKGSETSLVIRYQVERNQEMITREVKIQHGRPIIEK
ncbi:MAG: prepilin-type N-terminal cleavage/methylation domain-containing protein [Eubacteriaceae bacterium]